MYTNEEKLIIKENLKKIEDFCAAYIVPRLRKYENVSFSFNKIERKDVCQHSFTVEYDGKIYFRTGGLVLNFNDPIFPDNSVYDHITYCDPLFENWKNIREGMIQTLNRRENSRKAILNFQV